MMERPKEMQALGEMGKLKRAALYLLVLLLFVYAGYKFESKDIAHPFFPTNDLSAPWVASQAFVRGENPYGDSRELSARWSAECGAVSKNCPSYKDVLVDRPMAYPPTALALISPLGALDWYWTNRVYTYVSLLFFVAVILLLAQKLPMVWSDPRKLYFVAFSLAMAPLYSGSTESNLTTALMGCLCLGAAYLGRRPVFAGALFALAACIKPQMGILFIAYPLLRGKWKTVWSAIGTGSVASLLSVGWLAAHHVDWLPAFFEQARETAAPVGANGFVNAGFRTFEMLNLQILVIQFVPSVATSRAISLVIFVALLVLSAALIRKYVSDENEIVGLAVVGILTLLPVYQRFYGAEVLVLALFWSVANWSLKRARAIRYLLLPLLVPVASWLEAYDGHLKKMQYDTSYNARFAVPIENFIRAHHLDTNWWSTGFIWPHVIWIELIVLGILYFTMVRSAVGSAMPSARSGAVGSM